MTKVPPSAPSTAPLKSDVVRIATLAALAVPQRAAARRVNTAETMVFALWDHGGVCCSKDSEQRGIR